MPGLSISGADKVLANLNTEIMGIKERTRAGMWEAGLLVKRESVQLTPIDTGNLRASAYVRVINGSTGPGVEIGYMAAYAVYVHEIDKNYHVGMWKFLQAALHNNVRAILEAIWSRAKIPPGGRMHVSESLQGYFEEG